MIFFSYRPGFTYLVTSSISQAREERGELAGDRRIGVLFENDLFESAGGSDLGRPFGQQWTSSGAILSNPTRDWLLINRLAVVSTCVGKCQYLVSRALEGIIVIQGGKPSARRYQQSLGKSHMSILITLILQDSPTGTEKTSGRGFSLDILGGGASTGLGNGRHLG